MGRPLLVGVAAAALLVATACSGDDGRIAAPTPQELTLQGGSGTVDVAGNGAFAQPMPHLSNEQRRHFFVGNSFFNDNWVTAPASATGRDGLGPVFNAQSCSSCHFKDGRGQPPASPEDPARGLLLRISVLDDEGRPVPHPSLGDQFQDRSIRDVPSEGSVQITTTEQPGSFADGEPFSLGAPTYVLLDPAGDPIPGLLVSPRVAPPIFGVGLLENVPAEQLEALEDPDDGDDDGISGRVHRVLDPQTGRPTIGRFGWKASVPTVRDQNANAFNGDLGITSSIRPEGPCTGAQPECLAAPHGGEPELDDQKLDRVTFYARTLAVPARRDVTAPDVADGARLMDDLGCTACHVAELTTGRSELPDLDRQTIRPFTDLLLHDLGPGLADDRQDDDATGREWRTAPLWGIGLTEAVNGHTRFLHDGRARNLTEAILWHGGEAEPAKERFRQLSRRERAALLRFLESL
ncbi:MAG: c-type cytochrome [Actinomycetota bacterium]|nr:c-type cytochrome [Actinomycetota bacterium]